MGAIGRDLPAGSNSSMKNCKRKKLNAREKKLVGRKTGRKGYVTSTVGGGSRHKKKAGQKSCVGSKKATMQCKNQRANRGHVKINTGECYVDRGLRPVLTLVSPCRKVMSKESLGRAGGEFQKKVTSKKGDKKGGSKSTWKQSNGNYVMGKPQRKGEAVTGGPDRGGGWGGIGRRGVAHGLPAKGKRFRTTKLEVGRVRGGGNSKKGEKKI